MSDPVLVEKATTIQRSVARAREQLAASEEFSADLDRQDIAVLNLQRACEASIDMAFRLVRTRQLGAPKDNADAFEILRAADVLPRDLADTLKKMVGFRSIAVHRYQELDMAVVESVIRHKLEDLLAFSALALPL